MNKMSNFLVFLRSIRPSKLGVVLAILYATGCLYFWCINSEITYLLGMPWLIVASIVLGGELLEIAERLLGSTSSLFDLYVSMIVISSLALNVLLAYLIGHILEHIYIGSASEPKATEAKILEEHIVQ